MRARSWPLLLGAALGLAVAGPSSLPAQSPCAQALAAAEASFERGAFEDVAPQLEPCRKGGGTTRAEMVRVEALQAQAWIALDDLPRAREVVRELLRAAPDFEAVPPPAFRRLIEEVRQERRSFRVHAVSGRDEDVRQAPATVIVVTSGDIARRGYLDLVSLLDDLPGIDITHGNGEIYASLYPRGLRNDHNDKLLVLVDGIEQNDLTAGIAYLSRQYPMSSIDRVEVVYGPVSSIYGSGGLAGSIQVFTKAPEDLLPAGKRLVAEVEGTAGDFGTEAGELSLAGRSPAGAVTWLLAGRFHRSDEADLSRFADWDGSPGAIDYRSFLRLTGAAAEQLCGFDPRTPFTCPRITSPNIQGEFDAAGRLVAVVPSELGIAFVRATDAKVTPAFADSAQDWSLQGQLRFNDLTLGFQTWRAGEGAAPWYRDLVSGGRRAFWAPRQTALFLRYGRPLGRSFQLGLSLQQRQARLDDTSGRMALLTYANRALGFNDLARATPREAQAELRSPTHLSSRFDGAFTLDYEPSALLSARLGLELRRRSVALPDRLFEQRSILHTDLGLAAQTTWKPRKDLSLVLGGRLDQGRTAPAAIPASGFGTVFSPRAALAFTPGPFTFKVLYAAGFQEPAEELKLVEDPGFERVSNLDLRPARARNLELSAAWRPSADGVVELSAYEQRTTGLPQLRVFDCAAVGPSAGCGSRSTSTRFENRRDVRSRGLQLTLRQTLGAFEVYGGASLLQAFELDPEAASGEPLRDSRGRPIRELRVGDLATRRADLGTTWRLSRCSLDLRAGYTGPRRTGAGTTVSGNPLTSLPATLVARASVRIDRLLPWLGLQLIADNLFDERYSDPGVVTGSGPYAASIPQPGRALYFRLSTRLAH